MKRLLAIFVAAALMLSVAGCGLQNLVNQPRAWSRGNGAISVVATTNVWADLAFQIGGKLVTSHAIIYNINQDPHSFEASVRDQLLINKADLVLINGGGYDDFMNQLIKSSNHKAANVIDAVKVAGTRADSNEHIWFSISRMRKVAVAVANSLKSLAPQSDSSTIDSNLATVNAKLDALASKAAKLLPTTMGKRVLLAEPVSAYLVDELQEIDSTPHAFSAAVEEGRDVPPQAAEEVKRLLKSGEVALVVFNSATFDSPSQKLLETNWPNTATVTIDEVLSGGGYFEYFDQAMTDLALFNGVDVK